ncbi:LysR substrate-binding domain-containing protein [Sedimentitalea sp. XS_ASV28]|uniref:LysR substrate-binding domain-containing protein n=1 Tax=Sedimentitalea sp. XS_ASV28 TaxID=3241296 RepID=UPI00351419A3
MKWLEDFLTLAQTRNFSQASSDRNITQPAFSRRIRALETWLGVSLFDRRSYPVTLTAEGRVFRDSAESILATLYANRTQLQETQIVHRPDLRIAAATTLNLNFIPNWLRRLEPQTGHLTTHIFTQNFHDMAQNLAEGEIDLVLQYSHSQVPLFVEASKFMTHVLTCEPMVLVSASARNGEPLHDPTRAGNRGGVFPYMGYSRDGYFAEVERILFARHAENGLVMQRLGESPISEVLKRMAISYGALTLLPESCAREAVNSGELVVVGDEDWQIPLEVRLYRARGSQRPAVKRVWDAIQNSNNQ